MLSRHHALHGLSNPDLSPHPLLVAPGDRLRTRRRRGPRAGDVGVSRRPADEVPFLTAVRRLERFRRPGGAIRWNVYGDTGDVERWVEVFVVESWLEHLRRHERMTAGDRIALDPAARFHSSEGGPRAASHRGGAICAPGIPGSHAARLRVLLDSRCARRQVAGWANDLHRLIANQGGREYPASGLAGRGLIEAGGAESTHTRVRFGPVDEISLDRNQRS